MRKMGILRQIVEETTGLEITHVHDDLVFVDKSAVLLRFDDADFDHFFVYVAPDCDPVNRKGLLEAFDLTSRRNGMRCSDGGGFTITELAETKELRIDFVAPPAR